MISVTIIIKDGERLLATVLEALKPFAEVVLYDTGSTDRTCEIAAQFENVAIVKHSFEGFGKAHNEAARLASNDWILSIDADEVVSEALCREIFSLDLDNTTVYSIPFDNYFNGKKIRGCGWSPDRHLRLYNRKKTAFSDAQLHEKVLVEGMHIYPLKHAVRHYSYGSISDFLVKMERYSTLFAREHQHKRRSSHGIALWHSWTTFLKSYLLKLGILDGYEGYLISVYNAQVAYYKYLKLYHYNRENMR